MCRPQWSWTQKSSGSYSLEVLVISMYTDTWLGSLFSVNYDIIFYQLSEFCIFMVLSNPVVPMWFIPRPRRQKAWPGTVR